MSPLTIVHLSDLHFFDSNLLLKRLLRSRAFFSKRLVGMLNVKLRRKNLFEEDTYRRLLDCVKKLHWDYLVISGDLTNLSTEGEFLKARELLEPLIKKGRVILTAGNHDRYVRSALRPDPMERYFGDCFPFRKSESGNCSFPTVELDDGVVLFELELATPRFLFSSRGKIKSDLTAIRNLIGKKYSRFRKIAVGHYPAFLPETISEGYLHKLSKRGVLRNFLIDNDIDLYLHGHIHKSWAFSPVEGSGLVCVNSGGCCRYEEGDWAGFHVIRFEKGKFLIDRIRLKPSANR